MTDEPKQGTLLPFLKKLLASRWMGGGCLWLLLAVNLLLILSRVFDRSMLNRENEYLGTVLLEIMIFLLPAAVFCRFRGEGYAAGMKWRIVGADRVFFLITALLALISGCLLVSLLTSGMQSLSGSFSLYETFIAKTDGSIGNLFYLILAYAALPAVAEEFVFRGILCREWEQYGVLLSVGCSSVFFALLHLSPAKLPVYLFAGVILGTVYYATKSLFAAIIVHFAYNLFCLFGQPYITSFYAYSGNTGTFLFLLTVLLLLSLALGAGQAARFYRGYADRNLASDYRRDYPLRTLPRRIFEILGYPVALLTVLLSVLLFL